MRADVILPDPLNVEEASAQSYGFPWNLLAVQERAYSWDVVSEKYTC